MARLAVVLLSLLSRMQCVIVKQQAILNSTCRTSNQQLNTVAWLLWPINCLDLRQWTVAFIWNETSSLHLHCACSRMMSPCTIMCCKPYIRNWQEQSLTVLAMATTGSWLGFKVHSLHVYFMHGKDGHKQSQIKVSVLSNSIEENRKFVYFQFYWHWFRDEGGGVMKNFVWFS